VLLPAAEQPAAGAVALLPPPLLLSMQIGYNELERRQSDGRNRHSGDNKRNRNEKLERKIRWQR
jgi:hypothetical protein